MMVERQFAQVEVNSREDLRNWLALHHNQTESIWLVSYKKAAGAKYLSYDQIVEEALSFGWIDSRPRSLDQYRSMHLLSPRKPGSAWSKTNRERAERLMREGRMAAPGIAKVEAARRDGSWNFLQDVQANEIPTDLAAALRKRPRAAAYFDAFPPSSKRIILEWIKRAKLAETRRRRIRETVDKAAQNIRANHYRQPEKSSAIRKS